MPQPIYSQGARWNLEALLPANNPEALATALEVYEKKVAYVESWRDKLRSDLSGQAFIALLDACEAMAREERRLLAFAQLCFAADTQDQAAIALLSRLEEISAQVHNRTLFFSLWWKGLDPEAAQRLLADAGDRRYWLESLRRFRPHTLSEEEEKIINLKNVNGVNALETLYQMITNKFTYTLEVDGEKRTLTRDALMSYVQQPDAQLRAAAYQELYRVYAEHAPILAQIYTHLVRDWYTEQVSLRGFSSPIAVRNLHNDLPDSVVETLLQVIVEQAPVFQRYFRLKARLLGLSRLRRYDLFAPLSRSQKEYPYPQAVEMVLDTFTQFAPQVGALAWQVFDEGHVDAGIRPGKRSGAFCLSVFPDIAPWVLLNYNSCPNDLLTLAHEMGHAVHSLLAGEHSLLTFHATLPLAETASVFAERLLSERLLEQEKDASARCDLLSHALDKAYASIGRQGFFALWEKEAHQLIREGRTAAEMADRYRETLYAQFGDAVDVSNDFRWEWISIPHFYETPFYVYAYAFGNLLVLALFRMFQKEGEAFKARYLKILGYGGSAAPLHILSEAGIDVTSADFWRGGYEVINTMIDELEALVG